jgi:MFS family permease
MSAFGGGMLAGMLIAGSIKLKGRQGRLVIGVTFVFGLGLSVLGYSTQLVWACAVLVFIGLGGGLANIIILALVQAKTDKRMLGRVMGLMMFAMAVLEPLSFALSGAMADANLTLLFAAAGAIILATSILSLGNTALRSGS